MSFLHPNTPHNTISADAQYKYWQLWHDEGVEYFMHDSPQNIIQHHTQNHELTPITSKKSTANIIQDNNLHTYHNNVFDNDDAPQYSKKSPPLNKNNQQQPIDVDLSHITSLDIFWNYIDAIDNLYDKGKSKLVKSKGVLNPQLLVIADAPMDMEETSGKAFSSTFFTNIIYFIEQAGFNIAQCHFSHITFWRPAGNNQGTAQPYANDLEILSPYLKKHISLVNPQKILLLGHTACHAFHQHPIKLLEQHGDIYTINYHGNPYPFMHSFGALAFNKQPIYKKAVWFDLLKLQQYNGHNDA